MQANSFHARSFAEAYGEQTSELANEFQEVAHVLAEAPAALKPKAKLHPGELAAKHAPSSMPKSCSLKGATLPHKVLAPLEGIYKCVRSERVIMPLEVGHCVEKGQVLGYIEVMAMQCMIQAPCKGVLEAVQVAHGRRVDLDQCLMVIRPQV